MSKPYYFIVLLSHSRHKAAYNHTLKDMRNYFRDIQVQRGIKIWNYSHAIIAVVKTEVSYDTIYVTSCEGIYFCKSTILDYFGT